MHVIFLPVSTCTLYIAYIIYLYVHVCTAHAIVHVYCKYKYTIQMYMYHSGLLVGQEHNQNKFKFGTEEVLAC